MHKPAAVAPPTVLVVDDNPALADILTRFLFRHGLAAISAYSGEQGLEKIHQHAIDAVLLDVVMPGMDGLAVCAALQESVSTRSIPIILLTAKDDMESVLAESCLGVCDILVKPVGSRELLARVQYQIETHRPACSVKRRVAAEKNTVPSLPGEVEQGPGRVDRVAQMDFTRTAALKMSMSDLCVMLGF